jgi:glycyl-tRNA synthetase
MHRADKIISDSTGIAVPEGSEEARLEELIGEHGLKCPACGGELSGVKRFNMMMGVMLGPLQDQECYLRPETCQSIFCDYLRLTKSMRVKLPFGIAQEGTAFRNEISPRNFLFRQREFGQIECEIFFDPEKIDEVPGFDEIAGTRMNFLTTGSEEPLELSVGEVADGKMVSGRLIAYYLAEVQRVWEAMGFPHEKLRFRQVGEDEKPFYSRETWDFEVLSDQLGWVELVANNYRMDYDLEGHQKGSGSDLRWKSEDGRKFIPHVWEISAGLDRSLLSLLEISLRSDESRKYPYLSINPQLSPFQVAVFPLVKKDGLPGIAKEIVEDLRSNGMIVVYDESGSIGRRYARVDEVGCPFAITVDYRASEDGVVTLRDRDSTEQANIEIPEISTVLWKLKNGKVDFASLPR